MLDGGGYGNPIVLYTLAWILPTAQVSSKNDGFIDGVMYPPETMAAVCQ